MQTKFKPDEKKNGGKEEKKIGDKNEEKIGGKAQTASILPQLHCVMTASIGFFISASVIGWTGSALTKMSKDFMMGPTELSIVVSIISYGSLIGCCVTGKAMDSFGRRKVLLVTAPLAASGYGVIGLATSVYMVYIGRFICGLSAGIFYSSCPIYTNEVAQTELRGRLGALSTLTLALGTFYAFLVGGLFSWQISAFLCALPALLLFVNLLFVPESPYWYLLKENPQSASESLRRLRGPNYDVDAELIEMTKKISDVGSKVSFRELFKRRTLIPLTISLFVQTSQQLSAGNVVITFNSNIFEKAHSALDPHLATIYTGIACIIGTTASVFIIDKHGRRNLLAVSVALCGVFCGIIGGYFLALNSGTPWPTWAPFVVIILFILSFSLGCNSIPWMIGSEMFNTSVRSRANSVTTFHNRLVSILAMQMYPYLVSSYGESTVFLSYAVINILFAVGIVIFVPETKGKSLEEIQEYFESKASKQKSNKKGKSEVKGSEKC